jgi:SAM-dependent methyltransferase
MAGWGSGYVTDIPYSEGFYPSQAPQRLTLTAVVNGFEAPDLSRGFSYCELGCGKGLTSIILAAANPNAEFHAVDFNPAHIAHAQAISRAAELSNITWHETDFRALGGDGTNELPMFDFVTMHGIWSWVAPELQEAITRFLDRHLRPGGLLYVSYNAMPAWYAMVPVQRILKELASAVPGPSNGAVSVAIRNLNRLRDAGMIPDCFEPSLKLLNEIAQRGWLTYLAHEYLNEHWKPLYHTDVVRALRAAKLDYVGSASLLQNFENIRLTETQISLLNETATPEIRNLLKDFSVENWLREDVYVRGARPMHAQRRDKLLRDESICLIRPAPERISLHGPNDKVMHPHPEAYAHFFRLLEQRPRKVGELLALPELPSTFNGNSVGVVSLLIGEGFAAQFHEPDNAAVAASQKYNRWVEARDEIPMDRPVNIASAPLGIALSLSPQDFVLYMDLRRDKKPAAAQLARHFDQQCRAAGGCPVIDGKPLEDPNEALPVIERDYTAKIEHLIPLWQQAGII